MPGLYIHIPFCRKACHYCNFHFSTSLDRQQEVVDAIIKEIHLRKDYLRDKKLQSIYFGGGTPSLLTAKQLEQLFDAIHQLYQVQTNAEITLEANPDDLSKEKLQELSRLPINRLSIGVQSFFDEDLHWMNRVHDANQAEKVIKDAQQAGFENLTIDLIYGVPGLTDERWTKNLDKAAALGLNHISSYCLTVEAKTALANFIKEGKYASPDEEQAARQFELLVNTLESHGFEQYEVSNFARNGQYAMHNTNYWKNIPYIGLGPSAHSFNGDTRSWNIANNAGYVKSLAQNEWPAETEVLTAENRFNEYVMTGLRTIWGIDVKMMSALFPSQWQSIQGKINSMLEEGILEQTDNHIRIAKTHRVFSDGIAADLFA